MTQDLFLLRNGCGEVNIIRVLVSAIVSILSTNMGMCGSGTSSRRKQDIVAALDSAFAKNFWD